MNTSLNKKQKLFTVFSTVALSILVVWITVSAATTISNNVSTGGTLAVTGRSDFTGAVFGSSTLQATGQLTLYAGATSTGSVQLNGILYASSTSDFTGLAQFHNGASTTGSVQINGQTTLNGTAFATGGVYATGTLQATGQAVFFGGATTTGSVQVNGRLYASSTVLAVTGTLDMDGTASTTGLRVNGTSVLGAGGSTVTGMVFGGCTIENRTIQATSTQGVLCTSATGIRLNDRVFVMATSSLATNFIVQSASSTAADTIGLIIYNATTTNTATGQISLNFFAIR